VKKLEKAAVPAPSPAVVTMAAAVMTDTLEEGAMVEAGTRGKEEEEKGEERAGGSVVREAGGDVDGVISASWEVI
jgi:hypothetical protein